MPENKTGSKPYSPMITNVAPVILLSGDIDKIFDEVANPQVVYDFTVRLSQTRLTELLRWVGRDGFLKDMDAALKAGGDTTAFELVIEFIKIVEAIQKTI